MSEIKQNSEETKKSNTKKIKVNDEEKLLLLDDDDPGDSNEKHLSESELQEIVAMAVAEALNDLGSSDS